MAEPSIGVKRGYKLCANADCHDDDNQRTQIGIRTRKCPRCNLDQPHRAPQVQYALTAESAAKKQKINTNLRKATNAASSRAKPTTQQSSGVHEQRHDGSDPQGLGNSDVDPIAGTPLQNEPDPAPWRKLNGCYLAENAVALPLDCPEGLEASLQEQEEPPTKAASEPVTYARVGMQMLQQYLLAAQDGRMLFQLPAIGGKLASVVTILAADCTFQETNGSIAVSKERYYHVYAVPVQVKEGAAGMAMLCEYSSMEAAWRTVRGHDLTGCSLEGEVCNMLAPHLHLIPVCVT